MKRVIAALIAGVVLGGTGAAGAVTAKLYWKQGGTSYVCEGVASGVICKERHGRYWVSITPGYVGISVGRNPVMACRRGHATSSCVDGTGLG